MTRWMTLLVLVEVTVLCKQSIHSLKTTGGLKLMNSPVRFILGIAFFALLLVYSAASFYVWLYPPGRHGGWYFSGGFGEFQVSRIDPQGPAQELRPGDKIIAINGVKVVELTLAVNDTVLLLSDGLPERFNAAGGKVGDEREEGVCCGQPSARARNSVVR